MLHPALQASPWIPAYAGMTVESGRGGRHACSVVAGDDCHHQPLPAIRLLESCSAVEKHFWLSKASRGDTGNGFVDRPQPSTRLRPSRLARYSSRSAAASSVRAVSCPGFTQATPMLTVAVSSTPSGDGIRNAAMRSRTSAR